MTPAVTANTHTHTQCKLASAQSHRAYLFVLSLHSVAVFR